MIEEAKEKGRVRKISVLQVSVARSALCVDPVWLSGVSGSDCVSPHASRELVAPCDPDRCGRRLPCKLGTIWISLDKVRFSWKTRSKEAVR